jgi:hypothetical protein
MEKVNKHWKPIVFGVAAVGLAAYLYSKSGSMEHSIVQDIKKQRTLVIGTKWPQIRRIIDPSVSK